MSPIAPSVLPSESTRATILPPTESRLALMMDSAARMRPVSPSTLSPNDMVKPRLCSSNAWSWLACTGTHVGTTRPKHRVYADHKRIFVPCTTYTEPVLLTCMTLGFSKYISSPRPFSPPPPFSLPVRIRV